MNFTKKNFAISLMASLILSAGFFIFSVIYGNNPKYQFQLGEVARQSLKAPFSFTVYKPEALIQKEIYEKIKTQPPIYKISENAKFQVLKELDYFFIEINNSFENNDTINFIDRFSRNGYQISSETYAYLKSAQKRKFLYDYLSDQLQRINQKAIYEDNESNKELRIHENNKILTVEKSKLYSLTQAKQEIINSSGSLVMKQVLFNLLDNLLVANLEEDVDATEDEKLKIRKNINPVLGSIEKDEIIISKNQRISEQDLIVIESLLKSYKEKKSGQEYGNLVLSSIGLFVFNMIIFMLYFVITSILFEQRYNQDRHFYLVLSMLVFNALAAMIINFTLEPKVLILFPFSLFVIILAYLFIPAYSFVFSFFNILLLAQYSNWNYFFILSAVIPGLFAIYSIKKNKQINHYVLFLYMVFGYFITILALSLFRLDNFISIGMNLFYGIASSFLSITIAIIFLPVIEKHFSFASKQTLLELLDFNKPLLKRLAKEASGTYYHSLIVGNLAEAAAEAINANPLIARVGSYYHDIGKLVNTNAFIENSQNSSEIHSKLEYKESAALIKDHVINGIKLAKLNKLPQFITEIIIQHHGTSKVKYFYRKALQENIVVDENDYTYNGQIPQTKEAALVMIADIVESTTKSLKEYSHEAIISVIDETLFSLIKEHQLDSAPITMNELNIVKETMWPILESVYRKRIEYPKESIESDEKS